MKTIIMALGLALLAPMVAHANLGDSFVAANERWGSPVVTYDLVGGGRKAMYTGIHGWVITQIWNQNDRAVAIAYYKPWLSDDKVNEFSQDEIDALWLSNTRWQGGDILWEAYPGNAWRLKIWDNEKLETEVQLEVVTVDNRQMHRLMFVTYEGLTLLHSDVANPRFLFPD